MLVLVPGITQMFNHFPMYYNGCYYKLKTRREWQGSKHAA